MAYGRKRGRPGSPLSTGLIPENITTEDLEGIPVPPPHLNLDGKGFYYRVLVYGKEFLHDMDSSLVVEAAETFQHKERMRRCLAVGVYPDIFIAPNLQPQIHPARKQLEADMDRFSAYLQLLGFSPMDRKKLDIELQKSEDLISEFVERQENAQREMWSRMEVWRKDKEQVVGDDS